MEPKKPPLSPMDLGGMRRTFSSKKFEAQFTDLTRPLGALYTPGQTLFRVWAPTASQVTLLLYPTVCRKLDRVVVKYGLSRR